MESGACANKDTDVQSAFLSKPGQLEVVARPGYEAPFTSALTVDQKLTELLSIGCECVQEDELRRLLESKAVPVCYDGMEPSGRIHIAQGVLKAINTNKLTRSGCVVVFWVADWFAMLNNKLGGDLKKIQRVGEYFIHVWKACGMELQNCRFLWASEEINRDPNGYWMRVMDIAQRNNVSRIKRCGQIMGRAEGDDQPAAQIMYPMMQCADIFYIGADIIQMGLDQRKVNMLAREYADTWNTVHKKDNKKRLRKPVVLSHAMMPGLQEGQEKMSKSDPDSAIFMEDTEDDVRRKIKRAFCPPAQIEGNPVIAYVERLVFPTLNHFTVARSEENGGAITFDSIDTLKTAYTSGDLHPGDLKPAVAKAVNALLQPVRDYFANDAEAAACLKDVRSFKITR